MTSKASSILHPLCLLCVGTNRAIKEATADEHLESHSTCEREIVMTRVVDAPRELVFDAWTRPDLLEHWLCGPEEWPLGLPFGGRHTP